MGQVRSDRELFWRGVLERQVDSGLSVARFCRQESISVPSLYAWRRKLREEAAIEENDGRSEMAAGVGRQLLPVQIEAGASVVPVRILFPQGASIEVPSRIDRRALVELLLALREAQRC